MMKAFLTALVLGGLSLTPLTWSPAQEASAEIENHATVKVVKAYLGYMLEQNWSGSSQLVEPKSLEDLRNDYVKRVKSTATLDEEKMVVEKFGVTKLEDIEKLSGAQFYVTYHKLLKERSPADPEVVKKVRESMKLRILSLALENEKLAHVLVRTKHNNSKVVIESVEVISLVKVGDKWMVGLNEQSPKVTPYKPEGEAATTEAPKPTTPAPAEAPKKTAPKSGKK
jgi:hypothetical protein